MLCDGPVKGRAADVLMACHTAAEVALRLVRPGRKVKMLISNLNSLYLMSLF
jgi:hypothetical protein